LRNPLRHRPDHLRLTQVLHHPDLHRLAVQRHLVVALDGLDGFRLFGELDVAGALGLAVAVVVEVDRLQLAELAEELAHVFVRDLGVQVGDVDLDRDVLPRGLVLFGGQGLADRPEVPVLGHGSVLVEVPVGVGRSAPVEVALPGAGVVVVVTVVGPPVGVVVAVLVSVGVAVAIPEVLQLLLGPVIVVVVIPVLVVVEVLAVLAVAPELVVVFVVPLGAVVAVVLLVAVLHRGVLLDQLSFLLLDFLLPLLPLVFDDVVKSSVDNHFEIWLGWFFFLFGDGKENLGNFAGWWQS